MKIIFDDDAWDQYLSLLQDDPKLIKKLNVLIRECQRNPFDGTGKPEPLRGNLKGWWSRRINQEHRLVYRVTGDEGRQSLEIIQCRFHY
jgi:toxin YoeB